MCVSVCLCVCLSVCPEHRLYISGLTEQFFSLLLAHSRLQISLGHPKTCADMCFIKIGVQLTSGIFITMASSTSSTQDASFERREGGYNTRFLYIFWPLMCHQLFIRDQILACMHKGMVKKRNQRYIGHSNE